MSGFSMMFVGAAICTLAYIFVHYHGWNGSRWVAFVAGGVLFTLGTMHTFNLLHHLVFGG